MAEHRQTSCFIASRALAEIRRGVLDKSPGKRRDQLDQWFRGPQGPQALFAGRIPPFDKKARLASGELMADAIVGGRPPSGLDTIIAAIATARERLIVTDNERDFPGAEANPIRVAR